MDRYCRAAVLALLVFFSTYTSAATVDLPNAERIWADHEFGTVRENLNLASYALGYNFTPTVDGRITALGGNFDGFYQVKLFNRATGELLSETYLDSRNYWSYQDIAPISVSAGTQYTVAAYVLDGGASRVTNRSVTFPLTHGNLQIDGRTYKRIRNDANIRPTNNSTYQIVYGRADAVFIADEIEEPILEDQYRLTLDYDFVVERNGAIGDDVTWHVEKNGSQVMRRNAEGELRYRYFSNTIGSSLRIWLVKNIDGEIERVSNIVEYTPGTTDLFELQLDVGFELKRSGYIGDTTNWVIEQDGEIVLKRNAANELSYTYFRNFDGSKFRVWLEQFIDGEYKTVSNTVSYEVGQTEYDLTVNQIFELTREGQLGDPVTWVIEQDGEIVLQRNAANELKYTHSGNTLGSSFRVWLKQAINGQYEVVSDIVSYEVPAQYDYSLSIDSTNLLTRSGNIGDSLTWVIINDGTQVMGRNASSELTYRYHLNSRGGNFAAYLQQSRGGRYVQVSNTVTYSVP